jgi:hypothetical protein
MHKHIKEVQMDATMENLQIEYRDQNITPWGGTKLMKNLTDQTGIKPCLEKLDLPNPGSNRGYDPIDIVESFWVSVWIGASRFTHSSWLRYDNALEEIFSWKEVPSQSTKVGSSISLPGSAMMQSFLHYSGGSLSNSILTILPEVKHKCRGLKIDCEAILKWV